jgi:hypothetical protein
MQYHHKSKLKCNAIVQDKNRTYRGRRPLAFFNYSKIFFLKQLLLIDSERTDDGAESFQRRLAMTPNPRTGLMTLPEVITGDLAGKFSEISLYNQHNNFESGSASNSYSTSPWVTACESATEPSCADAPLHEHFPFGLCNASRAHAEALVARGAGKEIVSDYALDSNPGSGYYSDSSYEFDFGSDPDEPESENPMTEQPLSGPATGLVKIRLLARPQAYRPDRREFTIPRLPRLASLPGGNTPSSNKGAYSNRDGEY